MAKKALHRTQEALSSPPEPELLAAFEPLGTLEAGVLARLAGRSRLVGVAAGELLFRQGERDSEVYYLYQGELQLENEQGPVRRLGSGSEAARQRLPDLQPRMLSARASGEAVVIAIPRPDYEQALAEARRREEASGHGEEDWMLRLLQSELFLHLPPSGIQRIFTALEPRPLSRGEQVVQAGEPLSGFSFVLRGRCRLQAGDGTGVTLGPGDWFGEEALLEQARAHSTITVLEEGEMMFLPGEVFRELVGEPLVQRISPDAARTRVAAGEGRWVDVRQPAEYLDNGLEESVNLPLGRLREVAAGLSGEQGYVLYCDDGRRSAIAAFLLAARGIEAVCVSGGLPLESGSGESVSPPVLRKLRQELGEVKQALEQVLTERQEAQRRTAEEQARLRHDLEAMRATLQETRTLHLQLAELRQEVEERLVELRRDQESWNQRLQEQASSRLKSLLSRDRGLLERYRGEQEQQLARLQKTCQGLQEGLEEQRLRSSAIERLRETLGRLEEEAGRQREMGRSMEARWREQLAAALREERERIGRLLEERLGEGGPGMGDRAELEALARKVALEETRILLAEYESGRQEQHRQEQEELRQQRLQLEHDAARIRETLDAVDKIRSEARQTLDSASAEVEALRRSREEASRHGGKDEIERIDRELQQINRKVAEASSRLRMSEGLRSEADAALRANREELDRQARREAALQARLHQELEEWLSEQKGTGDGFARGRGEQEMEELLRRSRLQASRRKAHDLRLQEELREQLGGKE
ncbi:MAG: hypothetical protein D6786_05770 [Gammaproteobacteria bacterium]|nr:MAG: hypothetical protein D6786_05770 [Gammaproteobacteria bacterium]